MKKIISTIMCLSLLMGLLQFNIYAETKTLESGVVSIAPQDKISTVLSEKIISLDPTEMVPVTMWLTDLPLEDFEQQAWQTVSLMFELPASATICDESMRSSLSTQQLNEVIQTYIEVKRELVRQACTKYNLSVIQRLGMEDQVMYCSQYVPVIHLNMTESDIVTASKLNEVQTLDVCAVSSSFADENSIVANEARDGSNPAIDVALNGTFLNIDDAQDEFGVSGAGVKIGIWESGVPDTDVLDLRDLEITVVEDDPVNSHATNVTAICAEFAPDATYYCIGLFNDVNISDDLDWLISQGVNIINMSMSIGEEIGEYNSTSRLLDTYSYYDDVLFVIAIGNKDADDVSPHIYSSAMSYNAISVANYDHNNTITNTANLPNHYSDDTIYWALVRYNDAVVSGCAYKPDICAPGTTVTAGGVTYWGTSQATPHVSAIAALLMEQDPYLKLSPVSAKSILLAGVNKDTPHYYTPTSYPMDVEDEEGNPVATYRLYGAGLVDAYNSCLIAYSDVSDYRTGTMAIADTYKEYNVYFEPSNGEVRLVLSFEQPQQLVWIEDTNGNIIPSTMNPDLHDLDLQIYNPLGTLVGSSTTVNNNVEILDFTPMMAGVYKIRISKLTAYYIDTDFAIAWSKTNY